jgi:hypothetical protein
MILARKRKGGGWFNKPKKNERDALMTVPDDLKELRMENDAREAAKATNEYNERLKKQSLMTRRRYGLSYNNSISGIPEGGATRKRMIMRKRFRCSKRSRYV